MAEFLIKAISSKMPSLQTYKGIINKWVQDAQSFPYTKAQLIDAKEDAKRLMGYRWALRHPNRPEAQTIISDYEANPLTQDRINEIRPIIGNRKKIEHNLWVMTTERNKTDPELSAFLAEKDKRGSFKKGDIVAIQPDGWQWGKQEHPATQDRFPEPKFFIVKVPGLDHEVVKQYFEPETIDILDDDGDTTIDIIRCRKFHIMVDNLPQGIKNTILAEGEVTVNFNQLRQFIRNKVTGQTEG